jgi:hypothetical protein
MRLASRAKARLPTGVRVPSLTRRQIAQWRNACSASLFVRGQCGGASTRKMASQSLRNSTASARVFSWAAPCIRSPSARNSWSVPTLSAPQPIPQEFSHTATRGPSAKGQGHDEGTPIRPDPPPLRQANPFPQRLVLTSGRDLARVMTAQAAHLEIEVFRMSDLDSRGLGVPLVNVHRVMTRLGLGPMLHRGRDRLGATQAGCPQGVTRLARGRAAFLRFRRRLLRVFLRALFSRKLFLGLLDTASLVFWVLLGLTPLPRGLTTRGTRKRFPGGGFSRSRASFRSCHRFPASVRNSAGDNVSR